MELEDQLWFPQWMRLHQMEFLSHLAENLPIYSPVLTRLQKLFHDNPGMEWTDVCSGAGGPVKYLLKHLPQQVTVLLTDRYPGVFHAKKNMTLHPYPVILPQQLPPGTGLITMFNAFHHFTPQQQVALLLLISQSNRPCLISEILQPNIMSFGLVFLSTTIGQWLLAPLIKPFKWQRLFFIYLVPVHIITVLWDGIISVFKSRSAKYYRELAQNASNQQYSFTFTRSKGFISPVYFIQGNLLSA